ncbi:MAG: hypothetical protein HY288_20530 [Planctomycetia bacterium]|nr:hypothetical protein [Planctomycetia bacterium]
MKISRLAPIALLGVFGLVTTSFGVDPATDFVAWDVAGDANYISHFNNSHVSADFTGAPVSLSDTFTASDENDSKGYSAIANVSVSAYAAPGTLRVEGQGGAFVSASTPLYAPSAYANVTDVLAKWIDTGVITGPHFQLAQVHATLQLHGALNINTVGTIDQGDSQASLFLAVIGTGVPSPPPFDPWWGTIANGNDPLFPVVMHEPPDTIPLSFLINYGEPFDINVELSISAFSLSQTAFGTGSTRPASVGVVYDGDFSKTLTWGGITSVTDAYTGEPIEGWTITSASGFDYSKPAPEPSTLIFAALAGLALLAYRR